MHDRYNANYAAARRGVWQITCVVTMQNVDPKRKLQQPLLYSMQSNYYAGESGKFTHARSYVQINAVNPP